MAESFARLGSMAAPDRKKLGKYEISSEIARGSMGVVYAGFDPFVNRPVALKVALSDALKDPESGARFRELFFNEAHTAGMLRHPNILDVFDAGVDDDVCYIVMELVSGGRTLKDFCKADRLLPLETACDIVFKCAKALDYAHRQGVIHRDVKPSNILMTPDGEIKIADFSIAHLNRPDTSSTLPMGFVGSPRYMSPEQVQEDTLTNQTDLFSLGVIAYELVTGQHPFGGESFSTLIYRVINESPRSMAEFRSDLPAGLEPIVMRALEKDPAKRYSMGFELATDLSRVFHQLETVEEQIPARAKFEYAKGLEFFRGFPDAEIWEVVRAGVWSEVDPGEVVIREGSRDDAFFIILSGRMEVRKGGATIDTLGPGDCFGEIGFVTRGRRSADVIASTATTLLKISATLIEQLTPECQLRFARTFMRILAERLLRTTERLASG